MCPLGTLVPHVVWTHNVFTMRPLGIWVRVPSVSLPCQHSLNHYCHHIENFSAPNGLCSSITESEHISAVKKPWRRSSRFEALKQMLIVNTRNDKLAATYINFTSRGMLRGTCLGEALQLQHQLGDDGDESASNLNRHRDLDSRDLDLNDDSNNGNNSNNDNNDPPGLVDEPPVFSKVTLALRRGLVYSLLAF